MQQFIEYLESKNHSKATQGHYLFNVNRFLQWHGNGVENCTKKDILKYLEHLKTNKNQENITRNNNLIALNHYFTFLVQSGAALNNPTTLIKIRGTQKKKLYNIYTFEQLEQLHDDFYHKYIRSFDHGHIPKNQRQQSFLNRERNYIMLGFLIYQGLATNELQRITLADIDLNKATVKIARGIKSSERTIKLNASQIGSLINYINIIRPQFFDYRSDENQNLFLPLPATGKFKTNSQDIMGVIKPITKQVRTLDTKFTKLAQIRASAITHWIKTYGLRKTQYLAGHKYIHTTETYLPNDLESLTDDITKFNPF